MELGKPQEAYRVVDYGKGWLRLAVSSKLLDDPAVSDQPHGVKQRRMQDVVHNACLRNRRNYCGQRQAKLRLDLCGTNRAVPAA